MGISETVINFFCFMRIVFVSKPSSDSLFVVTFLGCFRCISVLVSDWILKKLDIKKVSHRVRLIQTSSGSRSSYSNSSGCQSKWRIGLVCFIQGKVWLCSCDQGPWEQLVGHGSMGLIPPPPILTTCTLHKDEILRYQGRLVLLLSKYMMVLTHPTTSNVGKDEKIGWQWILFSDLLSSGLVLPLSRSSQMSPAELVTTPTWLGLSPNTQLWRGPNIITQDTLISAGDWHWPPCHKQQTEADTQLHPTQSFLNTKHAARDLK